jgi:hypothetical protein
MILTIAAAAIAAHLGSASPGESNLVRQVQYCGNGYDLDIHGRCYPNGVIPPQYQAARQGRTYGRYGGHGGPVPCGNGADVDIRDGQCYPNGTVPWRYQQGRQYQRSYY